jgi:hypothetical protein
LPAGHFQTVFPRGHCGSPHAQTGLEAALGWTDL